MRLCVCVSVRERERTRERLLERERMIGSVSVCAIQRGREIVNQRLTWLEREREKEREREIFTFSQFCVVVRLWCHQSGWSLPTPLNHHHH